MNTAGAPAPGKLLRALFWLGPPLFCAVLYRYGILAWFQADDFAWLSLHQRVQSVSDLWTLLFEPMAQGTVRPLSERAFFLACYHWFGWNALPYRLLVFATQGLNLALLGWVVTRITGSRAAGFWAALLWTANSALVTAMVWTSAYNQVLCAACMLTALTCWMRYLETGRWWWYWYQVAAFAVGFGALEINVVYPALAAAYALLLGPREKWRAAGLRLAPLVLLSVGYFVWHSKVAPTGKAGPYALHLDASIFRSLGIYLRWAFVPSEWESMARPQWIAMASLAIFAILVIWLALRRSALRPVAWFAAAWFGITITPVLPLRDHVTDYYLTLPVIGVAMLLGAALAARPRVAALPVALYLAMMLPAATVGTRWYADRSRHVRTLVLGVMRGREQHPGKAILLDGVDDELYAAAIAHSAFGSLGVREVYLAPDALHQIEGPGNLLSVGTFTLPAGPALRGLAAEQIVVYRAGPEEMRTERLKNVTGLYEQLARVRLTDEVPERVDVGNRLDGYLVGQGWYEREDDHRWMSGRGTLRLGYRGEPGAQLELTGWCPVEQVRSGALRMQVFVNGVEAGEEKFTQPELPFHRLFKIPEAARGQASLEVTVAVDRTFGPPKDDRNLGLAFGVFEIIKQKRE